MIPNINLLPKSERSEKNAKVFYSILGIIGLLLLSLIVWLYFSAKSDIATLSKEEETLTQQRDQLQSELDVLIAKENGSWQQAVAFVERVSYPVSPLMDEVRLLLGANSYLRNYTFGETTVSIQVDFETLGAISTYITALEKSEYFSDVQITSVQQFDLNPNGAETDVDFTKIPRYATEIDLVIDQYYLLAGGRSDVQQ